MGKISKYSNLYDKDGKLIRSVDSVSRRLDDYTIEELENLVDELAKDETKRTEYTNSMSVLIHMYETKGNPHKDEIVNKINEYVKTKTTKAEVVDALNDVKNETEDKDVTDDEVIERYEKFKNKARKDGPGTEGCVSGPIKIVGGYRGRSRLNKANTTISTAA